jgi:hypothetical protein
MAAVTLGKELPVPTGHKTRPATAPVWTVMELLTIDCCKLQPRQFEITTSLNMHAMWLSSSKVGNFNTD